MVLLYKVPYLLVLFINYNEDYFPYVFLDFIEEQVIIIDYLKHYFYSYIWAYIYKSFLVNDLYLLHPKIEVD